MWLAAMAKGLIDMTEMVLDKLRVNVIIVALLATFVTVDFGDKLIGLLDVDGVDVPIEAVIGVLGIVIGTGLGGLIATMVRMFESPSVPADVHERVVKGLTDQLNNKK